jgi:hypothetical protein
MNTPNAYVRETYARFVNQVESAKAQVSAQLDLDVWSRKLSDNEQVYAFLVTEDIYKKYELRNELTEFIKDVFKQHHVDIRFSEWRTTSDGRDPLSEPVYLDNYYVDYCGSRCRKVTLKHHLLLVLGPAYWEPSAFTTECIVPRIPYRLHKKEEDPTEYEHKEWVVTD